MIAQMSAQLNPRHVFLIVHKLLPAPVPISQAKANAALARPPIYTSRGALYLSEATCCRGLINCSARA